MSARKRRSTWPWIAGLTVVAGVVLLVARRGGAGPASLDQALIVAPRRGALVIEIAETGRVQPREKVEIKSKVAGQVAEVLVDEGMKVTKGQLILVLDPSDYQRDVARADADVALAKNALDFARVTLARKKAGVDAAVTPLLELDAAAYDVVGKAAALQSARVALGTAQDSVRYTRITSPMDGTVIQRGIQPGETVVPGVQSTFDGKPLLTVAELSTLVVKIELNQIDIAKVHRGQAVELTLDALPGRTYQATITKIAPASMRPAGRDVDVFPVEATLDEVDSRVLPGMTADARIQLDGKRDVLSLPIEAIVKGGGRSYVTRVIEDPREGRRTETVEVTLGARNDRVVEIVSGLEERSRVLLSPPSAAENEVKM